MKRQISQSSNIGILSKAVVTATLLGCTAIPQGVQAGQTPDIVTNGVYVSILNPTVNVADSSKQIEVSAFYQAAPVTGGVTTLELYADGQRIAVKPLDTPENRGVVSFVISPGTLSAGRHHIVVRVSASDAEVSSATTKLDIAAPTTYDSTGAVPSLGGTTESGAAPVVAITTPAAESTIEGTIDIKVDAHDANGKAPYVSLFIDHTFKTLRNFPPFDFAWDTTRVANGIHTIEVWGYNDDQAVGHAQPLTVYVNNPGGRTLVRHDLLDTVSSKMLASAQHKAMVPTTNHHPAVKAAASLAKGRLAIASKMERLASTEKDLSLSGVPEQDQLMSPFLANHVALNSNDTVADGTVAPALAHRSATSLLGDKTMSTEVLSQKPSVSDATELISPIINEVDPQTSAVAATPNNRVEIASATVPEMRDAFPTNVDASSYSIHLETSTQSVADDQVGPSLESPGTSLTPAEIKAFAAQVRPPSAGYSVKSSSSARYTETKMASASVGTSSLASSGLMLQAPELPTHHVLGQIATHFVPTHMMALGSTGSGFPEQDIVRRRIVMNDHTLLLSQPLQDRKAFLFAPFRQIFENEGGVMAWNPGLHQVHALNGSRDVEVTIGSKTATVNQQQIPMNAAPYIVKGHTMIPLAFVPIALDATVSYDPATGHIVINSNN
jgi:hypothetical protein